MPPLTATIAMPTMPRPEYPRPQWVRRDWLNLNGVWTCAFDPGRSGAERGWARSTGFDQPITVPFCPESPLSGVGQRDFIERLWYHRRITVPRAWEGRRVRLHCGAVDYACELFVDGQSVGRHYGGTVSFWFDVTRWITFGQPQQLVLAVEDDTRSCVQPGGKQSHRFASFGCHYTRTTGIWQTVWLEPVAPGGVQDATLLPDLAGGRLTLVPEFAGARRGARLEADVLVGDRVVASAAAAALDGTPLTLALPEPRPWSPEDPFLHDVRLRVRDAAGAVLDEVTTYAGLRQVHVEDGHVWLNGEPRYLRFVLDQGFYPDGIWTAPTDAALRQDIELSLAAGFNGARLHQKVFEPRFHYWADRLGYLTWGESSSWGCDVASELGARNFLSEWGEILRRDRNHPSIIGWTPFNETSGRRETREHRRLHLDAYALCHALDPTRPVNDSSGYVHVQTDLYTVHNYEQDPEKLRAQLTPTAERGVFRNFPDFDVPHEGQPYIVDEFGGIKWIPAERAPNAPDSWGYGQGPKTLEEFYARLDGQVAVLLSLPHVAGYCYTQLTDVEQEQNGIYCYDRAAKFDLARVSAIFRQHPASYPR